MKKKGSLALSTNAIVVLIIAITILGLALAFTRNIFGNLGKQIEDIGKQTLVDNPPSFEKPFTLSKAEFDLRRGMEVSLGAGFFNKFGEERLSRTYIHSCYMKGVETTAHFEFTEPGPKIVAINQDVSFSTSISALTTAPSGIHSCTLKVEAKDNVGSAPDQVVYQDILINIK